MIKKFLSRFSLKPFAFKTKSSFTNCTNQQNTTSKYCTISSGLVTSAAIFGLGLYAYSQGLNGFSKIAANHNLRREALEREYNTKMDVENCLEVIKSYKPSAEFLQRHLSPSYNPINIDNLLVRLKERKALCIKGSYGSGATEYAISMAEKWLENGNYMIYFNPHSRLQVDGRIEELLKVLNTKNEDSFLAALQKLREEKKEVLLVMDDMDNFDVSQRDSYRFLNFLKNLQEENFLHILYVFRTNLLERFITGLYNNDISLIFLGGNKFVDLQTEKERDYVSKFCNLDLNSTKNFLFFFGMNYKNMTEYNDFVKYNQENNKDIKNLEDFIDAKIEKVIDHIELKGNTNDVLHLCRTIDSNGIFNSDWKKHLTHAQRSSLENNDILVISGTTTALTRAAIAKLCEKSWKTWDLSKWRGKWNIEYYL